MKIIPLTQGQSVLVDDWNYDHLMQWKWFAQKMKNSYYAERHVYQNGKQKVVAMHREIMNTPPELEVDHIDHNGLNCLEENMRNCTHNDNNRNKTPWGKSKYLGVSYSSPKFGGTVHKYIFASIDINQKKKHLGYFKTEESAAHAYDEAAKIVHGKFANLNFKE